MPQGCWALVLFFALLILLPFFLADVMLTALGDLGLTAQQSLLAALGIFFGSAVNIPVTKLEREEPVQFRQPDMFGFYRLKFRPAQRKSYTLLAVNLGGCVIPVLLSLYQINRLFTSGLTPVIWAVLVATAINSYICYRVAKPVQHMGIAMPPLVPALVAAACALILQPDHAPVIAFISGVMGPLIGADFFHLKDISRISTGVASIGGAGTFDGIVVSGIIATLLA